MSIEAMIEEYERIDRGLRARYNGQGPPAWCRTDVRLAQRRDDLRRRLDDVRGHQR